MELNQQTLDRFCQQHKIIKQYIDDLPPEAIYQRLNPEKSSIHEMVAYLCRYQYIFMGRILSILEEVNPFFEKYESDNDPEFGFIKAKSTGALLHELYRLRDDMAQILNAIPKESCGRVGTHAILGKMNISQWVEFFLLHESNQLFKIFRQAGSFWSANHQQQENVIRMPLGNRLDELAG